MANILAAKVLSPLCGNAICLSCLHQRKAESPSVNGIQEILTGCLWRRDRSYRKHKFDRSLVKMVNNNNLILLGDFLIPKVVIPATQGVFFCRVSGPDGNYKLAESTSTSPTYTLKAGKRDVLEIRYMGKKKAK